MGQLVAGGLLVLGVIFFVAVVFIIRSEPDTQKSTGVPQPVSTEQEVPETPGAPDKALFPIEGPLSLHESAPPVADTNVASSDWHPLANGQFYELVNELRSVRTQAQELEHRLSALFDMVQRVDQVQNRHFPIEEEEEAASADTQPAH